MAIDKVTIGNMALSHCGISHKIESFDEGSAESDEVELWFDHARDIVLKAHDFSFARKRFTLALHGEDADETVWDYRYQYPADALVIRRLVNPLGEDADAVPYQIEIADDDTKSIATDLEDAVCVMTFAQTDFSLWDQWAIDILSHRLAAYVAFPLTTKRNIQDDQIQLFNQMLADGPVFTANEGQTAPPRDADAIRARV